MLRDCRAFWVLDDRDGPILDALTGAPLSSYEQLWCQAPPEPVGAPTGDTPVLAFEVFAEHHADERTVTGDLAADVLDILGAEAPARWDVHEPLEHPFDPSAITRVAQAEMPATAPMYASGAGSYLEIVATRTGVRERLRGGVVRGPGSPGVAAALTSLASSRHRVVVASLSELRVAAGPRWRRGPHHPEHLVAAYLGPAALGRTGLDGEATAERHGGILVGRARLPGVVVTFEGTTSERATAHQRLVADVFEGIAAVAHVAAW